MGDFVRRAHAQHHREPLAGQGIQACERRHGGLLFAHPFRLIDGRVSAVQQEVPKRSVRIGVSTQDRLVVHLEFQERGKCCDALTVCESKPGTITLSEPDARLTEAEPPHSNGDETLPSWWANSRVSILFSGCWRTSETSRAGDCHSTECPGS